MSYLLLILFQIILIFIFDVWYLLLILFQIAINIKY